MREVFLDRRHYAVLLCEGRHPNLGLGKQLEMPPIAPRRRKKQGEVIVEVLRQQAARWFQHLRVRSDCERPKGDLNSPSVIAKDDQRSVGHVRTRRVLDEAVLT